MSDFRIALLRNTAFFSSVSFGGMAVMLESAQTVAIDAGDYFFQQGEPGHYMYIVEKGSCRIIKTWSDREVQLGELGPGECFGEMALIDSSARSASVQAVTRCVALEISCLALQKLRSENLEQYTMVQENITRELCRRLKAADLSRMLLTESRPAPADLELPWPELY